MKILKHIINWLQYWQHLKNQKRNGKLIRYSIPRLNLKTGAISVSIMPNVPAECITINFTVNK
jgi:hypothetical protein